MGYVVPKDLLTRKIRDTVLSVFGGDGRILKRSTGSGLVEFETFWCCTNVQHTMWKVDDSLVFCVNFGLVGRIAFEKAVLRRKPKLPSDLYCPFRRRLALSDDISETWWEIRSEADVTRAVCAVEGCAKRFRAELMPLNEKLAITLEQPNLKQCFGSLSLSEWIAANG